MSSPAISTGLLREVRPVEQRDQGRGERHQGLVDQGPARTGVRHPGRHTRCRLGQAHHRQHPDLGHRAGRAAPGRQLRQVIRAPAPLPGSAFHRRRARRQPSRPTVPLPPIRWQRGMGAHQPFPGSSRPQRSSRPPRLPVPRCGCAAARQPPPLTASPGPAGRLPMLVLAGPGTGKTTAIVETVVERITGRGIDPERVLVLTFSRKAAEELRQRITARLGRTTREPLALTFHSYAYALVRREFTLAGDEPPTLLSGPAQLLEVRRMLRGAAEDGGRRWPERLRPALATRGFAVELDRKSTRLNSS